ncbi:MAG TPA: acetate--CoA ligase family protein, partial [bacterium]|nr:acetate--CoA ligase family protein [bacterium]
VGASANPDKIGHQVLKNIINGGFDGEVYPINPKEDTILDLPCFDSVSDVSGLVDLAVVVVPSKAVLSVVSECGEKGIGAVAVISAGFAETGSEGRALQDELVLLCQKNNMTLLGPNCLGIINSHKKLNASFACTMPRAGNIGFLSQSGAIISSFVDWSQSTGFGFSTIISLGNKAMLSEVDALKYLYSDLDTSSIFGYIEGFLVTPELTQVLKQFAKTKPTVFLVGGQSELGSRAAKSHTGAIISSYISTKTYLKQAGVIVADNLSDFMLYAKEFSAFQKIGGRSLAVVTNAGGPGIMASDAVAKHNLQLPALPAHISKELAFHLRSEASVGNPIDVLGDASIEEYRLAIEAALASENIFGLVVIITPQTATDVLGIANVIIGLPKSKPVAVCLVGGEIVGSARLKLEENSIPCFSSPDGAVLAMSALVEFSLEQSELNVFQNGTKKYDQSSKNDILEEYGIPGLPYFVANDSSQVEMISNKIGFPLVVKVADETGHKSDVGGVRLNIQSAEEAMRASTEIGFPVILGRMIKAKRELFIGLRRDPSVGVSVAFGTGGIYGQAYGDFCYRIAPLSTQEAIKMISETIIGKILADPRGEDPYDIDALAKIIVAASKMITDYENILEIDFNPILATPTEYFAVDVRVITTPSPE